jgi:EcsC protein family
MSTIDSLFSLLDPALFKVHDLFVVEAEDLNEIFQEHSIGPNKSHSSELPRRDAAADQLINGARVWSGIEGTSLGVGGIISMGPNILALMRTLLRLVQSVAWVYDAQPNSDKEKGQVWKILLQGISKSPAVAASSGVLSGQVAHMLIRQATQKLLSRLGVVKSQSLLRKLMPLVGALAQGLSNATFTQEIGALAKQHYREQFLKRFTIESKRADA